MSATRDATIWCDAVQEDGNTCGQWDTADTAADARKNLRSSGWKTLPGGRDICGECWAEGRR